MKRPTILVTGCAGYIGSVLVKRLLQSDYNVIGADKRPWLSFPHMSLEPHPRFFFIEADIRNQDVVRKLVKKADVIIPLAGIVGAPACEKDIATAWETNFLAISTLVCSAPQSSCIIYPNTNSGYGHTDGNRECVETDIPHPVSTYAESKQLGEDIVLSRDNSVVLRLATVFGMSPRMRLDLMVNDFTEKLTRIKQEGRGTLSIFEPHFKRNFVHIQDVCRVFEAFTAAAINKELGYPYAPGIYNFGLPNVNLTKLELAHYICDRLNVKRDVVVEDEGRDPDQRNYSVSNAKILSTGFKFKHGLDEGIRSVSKFIWRNTRYETRHMRNVC